MTGKYLLISVVEAVTNEKIYGAVITTGGTAISKGDLIVGIIEELGKSQVDGVSMKPGKPFGFGIIDETPIFMFLVIRLLWQFSTIFL